MHYHCEIVIPPTNNIEEAIKNIMAPFDENQENEKIKARQSFWDFYVIGGRWAGEKQRAKLGQAKIDEFYSWCKEEKITFSGLIAGKQRLHPESQELKVDTKWNEMFPSDKFVKCPLFAHSNDQYDSNDLLDGDICKFIDVPDQLTCSRFIVGKRGYVSSTVGWTGEIEAGFMLSESIWNGCNYEKTEWDGTFKGAIELYEKDIEHYSDEYKFVNLIQPDWLVVTVDYHS